jgi:RNA polymerase sigma-70 factor (ECF subfamily)
MLAPEQRELAARYAPLALAVADSWVAFHGAAMDADDLRQEACLGLCLAAASWSPEKGAFGPYARARARGAVLDALRAMRPGARRRPAPFPLSLEAPLADGSGIALAEVLAAEGPSPEELAVEAAEREEVRAALASLPPRERAVLELVAGGAPLRDAAARLGVSKSRASQLAGRGLKRLGDLLEGRGGSARRGGAGRRGGAR